MTETCPECGHEFAPGEDEQEQEDDGPREPVGECEDCGVPIRYGEWHVADRTEAERLPDESMQAVAMGDPDETTRWCAPCSDRPLDEYPEDEAIAGVEA